MPAEGSGTEDRNMSQLHVIHPYSFHLSSTPTPTLTPTLLLMCPCLPSSFPHFVHFQLKAEWTSRAEMSAMAVRSPWALHPWCDPAGKELGPVIQSARARSLPRVSFGAAPTEPSEHPL